MKVNTADRDRIIQRLKELLETVMKPDFVEEVYAYIPVSAQGVSPFIAIQPGGSWRTRDHKQSAFLVFIHIYVLYTMNDAAISEADSWLALSQIEQAIAEFLSDTGSGDYWYSIEWAEYSTITEVPLDNQGYLIEAIPLIIQAY